jgi:hypothetical protein
MIKSDIYREELLSMENWDAYLLDESCLPGPRANIELAQAVAETGDLTTFRRYLEYGREAAPYGSVLEFLPFCGVIGLGKVLAEGNLGIIAELRVHASDTRWRIREGVAMSLQRFGYADIDCLFNEMVNWSHGNHFERRAALAALCEPGLLRDPRIIARVLELIDRITVEIQYDNQRKSEGFSALRRTLGYCWSIAVAADPEEGKSLMEKWFSCKDKDIRWIMKENLNKNRLRKVDEAWTEHWIEELNRVR